jgi:hypothetical protein
MILTLPAKTIVGLNPATVDWSGRLSTTGPDFVRLANWSATGLRIWLSGRVDTLDAWTANVFQAFGGMSLRYEPFTVTPSAALASGSIATLLVTLAFGEPIPGNYPLSLWVDSLSVGQPCLGGQ